MTQPWSTTRLNGKRIFLSASIPSESRDVKFRRVPDAPTFITEAVVTLTRAVLSHGGILVMGAHPTISPLVMQVAGEYRPTASERNEKSMPTLSGDFVLEPAEPHIVIYQSKIFDGLVPEETLLLERLGYARIVWTDIVGNERLPSRRRNAPVAPKSLNLMRRQLLERESPDAMVCIGGMEGIFNEAKLFAELRPGSPIYVLASTGGAAALLAESEELPDLHVIDRHVIERIEHLRKEYPVHDADDALNSGKASESDAGQAKPEHVSHDVVYPLVMQSIVDELGSST